MSIKNLASGEVEFIESSSDSLDMLAAMKHLLDKGFWPNGYFTTTDAAYITTTSIVEK